MDDEGGVGGEQLREELREQGIEGGDFSGERVRTDSRRTSRDWQSGAAVTYPEKWVHDVSRMIKSRVIEAMT